MSFNTVSLPSFILPFLVGSAGVVINFLAGEFDRKKLTRKIFTIDTTYKVLFFFSIGIMIFALILGGIMNTQVVIATAGMIPYIIIGIAILVLVAFLMLKFYSSRTIADDHGEPPIV